MCGALCGGGPKIRLVTTGITGSLSLALAVRRGACSAMASRLRRRSCRVGDLSGLPARAFFNAGSAATWDNAVLLAVGVQGQLKASARKGPLLGGGLGACFERMTEYDTPDMRDAPDPATESPRCPSGAAPGEVRAGEASTAECVERVHAAQRRVCTLTCGASRWCPTSAGYAAEAWGDRPAWVTSRLRQCPVQMRVRSAAQARRRRG